MRKLTFSLLAAAMMTMAGMASFGKCYAQDSLSISGKGIYLWELWIANGGGKNLSAVVTKLKSVGVTWVVIKMGDGDSYYNSPNHLLYSWAVPNYGSMDSVISVFHSNGIKIMAFQYVYGIPHKYGNPASETDVANNILDVKGIDGLIIDAEIEYDTLATRVATARSYCDSIRAHHPNSFVGLTAWARVTGHSTFPWTTFLDRVQVNMAQTYWAARPTSPANELSLMSSQFTSNTKTWVSQGDSAAAKPIMPIGQGEYFGYSSDVAQGDISSFSTLSQSTYKYPGISLWEYNEITHSFVWDEYTAAWVITSVPVEGQTPVQYSLSQNYPNPFNPTTIISYTLPRDGRVTIRIYDALGREIQTLFDGYKTSGNQSVSFDASKFASGVYYYRLISGEYALTKKMLLMK